MDLQINLASLPASWDESQGNEPNKGERVQKSLLKKLFKMKITASRQGSRRLLLDATGYSSSMKSYFFYPSYNSRYLAYLFDSTTFLSSYTGYFSFSSPLSLTFKTNYEVLQPQRRRKQKGKYCCSQKLEFNILVPFY